MEATIVFRVGTDARSFFFPAFCQPPAVSQCVQPACAISLQNSTCPMGDTVTSTTAAAAAARRRSCWRSGPATAALAGIPHARRAPGGARRPCYLARLPRGRRRALHDGSPAAQAGRGVQGGGGARLVAADVRDALAERWGCCAGAYGGRE